jgi:metal-responsive CopG/Arc/MetJ family transcriptional regulator
MSRTLIDIPEADLQAAGEVAERQGVSRAAVIREAVSAYLAAHPHKPAAEAFGLWGTRGPDGVSLQRQLRDEW